MTRRLPVVSLIVVALLLGCDMPGGEPIKPKTTPSAPSVAANASPAWVAEARAAPPAKAPAAPAKMAPALGTVQRDTELKAKPAADAKTLRRLSRGAPVTVIDRDGGWFNVMSEQQQGWVRLLHVNTQPPGSRSTGAKDLESAARIATGRAGTGNVVATTGIRGLSEQQLRTAEPNPAELKKLEDYGVTKEQSADYARQQKLVSRNVSHVPEPR